VTRGYWLEEIQNEVAHELNVTNSGGFGPSDIDPFDWSLSIGELTLNSGSISASFVADELDGRFENIVDTCNDPSSVCDDLRFTEDETDNLLLKTFGEITPGIAKSYAKGFIMHIVCSI
jgi:hypothetical protein